MKTRLIPLLTLAAATCPAITAFADLEQLDSSQFDYKYEMLKLPTDVGEDQDGGGFADFTGADTWVSVGTGANIGSIFMNMTGGQYLISEKSVGANGDGWQSMGANSDTGYTVETRLKITESTGTSGALLLNASSGIENHNAWLQFYGDKITWGSTTLANLDTSSWHTYRIVRLAGENRFHVYVDGLLVNGNLGNGYGNASLKLNRLVLGSTGNAFKGKAQVAYLRFTKSPYAPTTPNDKSRRKASEDFQVKYEMGADDTRISTTANASDWTISGQSGATISMNGILSVVPNGKQTYWRTTTSAWTTDKDTAFTVDFSVKIDSCTVSGDRTMQILAGTPYAKGILNIGMNHVYWQPTDKMDDNILLDSSVNSDGKHVFRIAYDGKTHHGFAVWRDGVKIGEYLVDNQAWLAYTFNYVRFGIPGGTVGGSFDIDYIRWDTTGAYDWKDSRKGLKVVLK